MQLHARRVWSFDVDQARHSTSADAERQSMVRLLLNGPSAPIWVIQDRFGDSAASAATASLGLAIRRAALSRLPLSFIATPAGRRDRLLQMGLSSRNRFRRTIGEPIPCECLIPSASALGMLDCSIIEQHTPTTCLIELSPDQLCPCSFQLCAF